MSIIIFTLKKLETNNIDISLLLPTKITSISSWFLRHLHHSLTGTIIHIYWAKTWVWLGACNLGYVKWNQMVYGLDDRWLLQSDVRFGKCYL